MLSQKRESIPSKGATMIDRRKEERVEEENELIITVESDESGQSPAKIRDVYLNNYTKNISKSGVGIRTEVQLPVDALIELEFKSKGLGEQIKAFGKVKWVQVAIKDKAYYAGVEFSGLPEEAVKKLEDYITWKLKDKLRKKELTPLDRGDDRGEIRTEETPTKQPVTSGEARKEETSKQKSAQAGDIRPRAPKKKDQKPANNARRMKIAIGFLCAAVLAGSLVIVAGHLSEFSRLISPELTKIMTGFFARAPLEKEPLKSTAAPPAAQERTPIPEAAPAPETVLPSATSATPANITVGATAPGAETTSASAKPAAPVLQEKKFKVIGNSDTKRYHLPGMKYYNAVKAYHRVEFDSEADAIAAGYHKAPQ